MILLTMLLSFSLVLVYQIPKLEKEIEKMGEKTTEDITSNGNLKHSCDNPDFPDVCKDLCCQKCKDDFKGFGMLCWWQDCPEGYWPPNPNNNPLCVKSQPLGSNRCPEGWKVFGNRYPNRGVSCSKPTYARIHA